MPKEAPQPPELPLDFKCKCEIALTPDQKRIVMERTGREMDVLVMEDESGDLTRNMSAMDPDKFTLLAVRQAEDLNQYDEDYHQYLKELAEYQESLNKPDEGEQMVEALSIAAQQEAERQRLFYEKEYEECQNAREIAKIVWGKKD